MLEIIRRLVGRFIAWAARDYLCERELELVDEMDLRLKRQEAMRLWNAGEGPPPERDSGLFRYARYSRR